MKDVNKLVFCRKNCGACCIAPSISTPIPGMPQGKPAGIPCIHLDEMMQCRIFNSAQRPQVCIQLRPEPIMCGENRQQALNYLNWLENITS